MYENDVNKTELNENWTLQADCIARANSIILSAKLNLMIVL